VHQNSSLFGKIEKLFTSSEVEGRKFFVVLPLKKLDDMPPKKDPYASYPHLNAALISASHGERIVIDDTAVWGHAIVLKNQPGTFGIDVETCCAVGLISSVSFTCISFDLMSEY
jgi:hypothetical protein